MVVVPKSESPQRVIHLCLIALYLLRYIYNYYNNILAIQIVDKIVTKLRDNKKMIIAELNKTKNGFTKKLQDFMNETYSNAKKDEFYIKHVYDFL